MHIFFEQSLTEYLVERLRVVAQYINTQTAEYLLNVDEQVFVEHVLAKFPPPSLSIRFDDAYVTTSTRQVSSREHPQDFIKHRDWSAERQVLTYHLPFEGDSGILRCQPNPHVMSSAEVRVSENAREVLFDVIDFYNDAKKLKEAINSPINFIKQQYTHVQANLEAWAQALPREVAQLVAHRVDELKKRSGAIAELGIPIKSTSDFPDTFAVPMKRNSVFPPSVAPDTKRPNPQGTLPATIYEEILTVLRDMGRVMERHPSIYRGKQEEDLRDFFIMQLEPRFEGETTGETFNRGGKTDILIRHDGVNVFVSECKFWRGGTEFVKAIGQLQGYLTWRESKTAILLFVKNKSVQKVLEKLTALVESHPNHVETLEPVQEGWLRFRLSLPQDSERIFTMAVMVFHFPDDTVEDLEQ